MLLIVSFSCSISPFASTVIFWVRSPLANAVATLAMSLTWSLRFAASMFTFSVSSFQVPAIPGTSPLAPRFPSTPTSLVTLVISPPIRLTLSTMLLIVSLSCNISPFASTVIFWVRSPLANAVATLAMSPTWSLRFADSMFTLSASSFQTPAAPGTSPCAPRFPSTPTSLATFATSPPIKLRLSTILAIRSLKKPKTRATIINIGARIKSLIVSNPGLTKK